DRLAVLAEELETHALADRPALAGLVPVDIHRAFERTDPARPAGAQAQLVRGPMGGDLRRCGPDQKAVRGQHQTDDPELSHSDELRRNDKNAAARNRRYYDTERPDSTPVPVNIGLRREVSTNHSAQSLRRPAVHAGLLGRGVGGYGRLSIRPPRPC